MPFASVSTLSRDDTTWRKWAKMLVCLQAMAGSDPRNNIEGQEPLRMLQYKVARALGVTFLSRPQETPTRWLLKKMVDRANLLNATMKVSPPTPPFWGTGTEQDDDDTEAELEAKILSRLNQIASFSTVGAPAIDRTQTYDSDTERRLKYKLLKRLNQIGSGGSVPAAPTAQNPITNYGYTIDTSWSASAGATGYKLSWNGGAYVDVGNVLNFNKTGLIPNTDYHYNVKAYNGVGDSAASNTINVTSFSPIQLFPLVWLDASVGVTIVGGKVSAWADQSGNGNSFSQATAGARPTLNATALNGNPGVVFDGTIQQALSSAALGPDFPFSIFIVASVAIGNTNVNIFVSQNGAAPPAFYGGDANSGSSWLSYYNGVAGSQTLNSTYSDNVPFLGALINGGVADPVYYFNGVLEENGSPGVAGGLDLSGDVLVIGAASSDAANFPSWITNGDILIFGSIPSDPQRVQLEQYENIKYTLGF